MSEYLNGEATLPEGSSNSAVTRDAVETRARRWTWQPYAIVFVSSACIMILELVAGRIVAP
ncbi:MAG: hypothetical protein KDH86_11255, partial [Anaerolineae bacterium]|nr:hypothetical protein [Anaerolineae bacterium]